ncbi:MAG: hypothetical protein ACR2G5_05830 [Pyrinomonadaceae bacterium]
MKIRIEWVDSAACGTTETPFYLTTETPERSSTKPIIVTRPKPGISTIQLNIGDRVAVGLSSFTVLPDESRQEADGSRQTAAGGK